MGRQVGRWPEVAFDHLAIQVSHHHVGGSQRIVIDSAGLDDHQAVMAIDPTCVAEGEDHQTLANQFQIGFQHLLLQRFQGRCIARMLLGGILHRS